MRQRLIFILACLIVISAYAGDNAAMPLAVGNKWEYAVTEIGVMSLGEGENSRSMQTESEGTCVEEVVSVKERRQNGDVVYVHRSTTKTEAGLNTEAGKLVIESHMLVSKKGIFILASSASGLEELSSEWMNYDPPLALFSAEMSPGDKWKVGTVKEDSLRMPMTANVIGHETVTVPAGTFKDCTKIYVTCSNVKGSTGSGKDKMTVKSGMSVSTIWVSPAIGVVKEQNIVQIKMQFPPDEHGTVPLMIGTRRETKELLPRYRVGAP